MCSITHEIFKDPVLASEGNTYERWAINNWIKTYKKSPPTNEILDNNILNNNIAVRQMLTTLVESIPPEVEKITIKKL